MDQPITPSPMRPSQEAKSSGPYIGLGIGFVIIAAIVGWLIYSSRTSETRYVPQPTVMSSAAAADPYAAKLPITGITLSAADNMLGGTATYVEGNVANTGNRTVNGANVEVTFKNSMGQVVQRQTEPLWIVQSREPAIDVVSLEVLPLKPQEQQEFRLSFERISADWDKQPPELRITLVNTK